MAAGPCEAPAIPKAFFNEIVNSTDEWLKENRLGEIPNMPRADEVVEYNGNSMDVLFELDKFIVKIGNKLRTVLKASPEDAIRKAVLRADLPGNEQQWRHPTKYSQLEEILQKVSKMVEGIHHDLLHHGGSDLVGKLRESLISLRDEAGHLAGALAEQKQVSAFAGDVHCSTVLEYGTQSTLDTVGTTLQARRPLTPLDMAKVTKPRQS